MRTDPTDLDPRYLAVFNQQRSTPAGKLLLRYGFEPYDTESAARIVAQRAVEDIEALLIALNDTTEALAIAWQTLLPKNPQNDTIDASRALVAKMAHLSNVL